MITVSVSRDMIEKDDSAWRVTPLKMINIIRVQFRQETFEQEMIRCCYQ